MPALVEVGDGWRVRCLRWQATSVVGETADAAVARGDGARALVLEVNGLRAVHRSVQETVVAADGVSFALHASECVALVGESGSGKTTIARCIAGLHEWDTGTIALDGRPLPTAARERDRETRRRIQLIFQNPYDSLNPRQLVGTQVARPAQILRGLGARAAWEQALKELEHVRLPVFVAHRFPAELSGGERQRVAIARALAAAPDILVCDEITSSLDVSVQAAVLELLERLRTELGLAMLFITHNLGVVASIADRVLVLNAGRLCEAGDTRSVLDRPTHPYTRTLVRAAPRLRREAISLAE